MKKPPDPIVLSSERVELPKAASKTEAEAKTEAKAPEETKVACYLSSSQLRIIAAPLELYARTWVSPVAKRLADAINEHRGCQ